MDKINLDINTYSLTELENLFKLNKPYNEENILSKKKNLENLVLKSNINKNKQEELLIFLDNVKNKLINEYFNSLKHNNNIFNDVNTFDGNYFNMKNKNIYSVLENNKKINKSIIKKTYTIDSIFRENYGTYPSHDYIIDLPETVTNAVTMSISSIEMPLSYYNISEELNNNIFRIEISSNDASINDLSCNISLIPGLYESLYTSSAQRKSQDIEKIINKTIQNRAKDFTDNNNSLQDISNLEFKINLQSGAGVFKYINPTRTSSPNKIDLSNNNNNTKIILNFNVDNESTRDYCSENEIYQKLGWQLGFRDNKAIIQKENAENDDNDNNEYLIISPCICHISYPRYLYISIEDYQLSSYNHFSVAAPSIIAPHIVSRINILSCLEEKTAFKNAGAPGDYFYSNKHVREYYGPTNIKKLKIQILDEYGRNFTINNMDWSFVLSFECIYN